MVFIQPFEQVNGDDIAQVGGKNASLGEMIHYLSQVGIRVPSGFAITADAYRLYLEKNNATETLVTLLDGLDKNNLEDFKKRAHEIRSLLRNALLPEDLVTQVCKAYEDMQKQYGVDVAVAVRSSATAEDLPHASFAGQQETVLNVVGIDALLSACVQLYVSLFTDRALSYRIDHGFDHMAVALSIGVQKMVNSDGASAGVMFTLDTESGHEDVVFITSSYGFGESVVQGVVNPDEFYVHKPTLKKGFRSLLKKRCGSKMSKVISSNDGSHRVTTCEVSQEERNCFSLTDDEVLFLAKQAVLIEDHYAKRKGSACPMDIEWAKDAQDGFLYIVQARPETVHSQKKATTTFERYSIDEGEKKNARVVVTGRGVGSKIISGVVRIMHDVGDMSLLQSGEILVADMTDPDWEPIMKRAGGIITNKGGRTCHAAIVSRELGIPAVIGTHNATIVLRDGQVVTLDCSSGEEGFVYDGKVAYAQEYIEVDVVSNLPVDLMLNVAHPDEAFRSAMLPSAGVGLARIEFIINAALQIHPMALIAPEKVTDKEVTRKIDEITHEYVDKKGFFIDTLAREVGTIVAAFYPRPVIVRFSDFKSNEYKKLLGGGFFEPTEENPMLGFRGASRYYNPLYTAAFVLECRAMKKMYDDMGLYNLKVMIPFVRTVQEAHQVLALMATHGLDRAKDRIEIYMMVEVPSNVILIEDFSQLFDGFSIGSNDLTQLTLGLDRDSAHVASIGDERNEAVKRMICLALEGARKQGKKIGICGQAPSDFPEFARFLIDRGIDSISLSTDSLIKTMLEIAKNPSKRSC